MTFGELLVRLDGTDLGPVLCGDPPTPEATCKALLAHAHPAPLLGEMLGTVALWCRVTGPASEVDRAAVVNALGPLRRHHQSDEVPAQGLRLLGALVEAVDASFDSAALDASRTGIPSPRPH